MMRRSRLIGVVAAVLSMALAGTLASADQAMSQTAESFRDTFGTISYSGNDGTLNWSGSWQESGESDGPASGSVRVASSDRCSGGSGSCLRIGGASIENRGVRRVADLTDAVSASMSLSYRRESQGQATGSVAVQVSRNGGASWTTLRIIDLAGAKNSVSVTFDIGAYIASNTAVRFVGSGSSVAGYLHIDDVEVSADIVVPATTTTSIASPSTTTTVAQSTTTVPSGSTTTTTTLAPNPTSTTTSVVGGTTTTTVVDNSVTTSTASTNMTVVPTTTTSDTSAESVAPMPSAPQTSPLAAQSDEVQTITSQPVASGGSTQTETDVGVMTIAAEALTRNAASAGVLFVVLSGLTLAGVERRRDE